MELIGGRKLLWQPRPFCSFSYENKLLLTNPIRGRRQNPSCFQRSGSFLGILALTEFISFFLNYQAPIRGSRGWALELQGGEQREEWGFGAQNARFPLCLWWGLCVQLLFVSCLLQSGHRAGWFFPLFHLNQTVNQMGNVNVNTVFLFHFSTGGVSWQRRVLAPWWTEKTNVYKPFFSLDLHNGAEVFCYQLTKWAALSLL